MVQKPADAAALQAFVTAQAALDPLVLSPNIIGSPQVASAKLDSQTMPVWSYTAGQPAWHNIRKPADAVALQAYATAQAAYPQTIFSKHPSDSKKVVIHWERVSVPAQMTMALQGVAQNRRRSLKNWQLLLVPLALLVGVVFLVLGTLDPSCCGFAPNSQSAFLALGSVLLFLIVAVVAYAMQESITVSTTGITVTPPSNTLST